MCYLCGYVTILPKMIFRTKKSTSKNVGDCKWFHTKMVCVKLFVIFVKNVTNGLAKPDNI